MRTSLNRTEKKHQGFNPFSTETVLLVGYWSPILIPSFTLNYSYKTLVYVPILSVNWVNQLTGYELSPIK